MQGPAIRTAKELGLTVIAADGNADAPCRCEADKFVHIDLKDKEKLLESAKNTSKLAGIMTAGTDFSASVAYVAEKLGLPGISYETALNASDKERMRHCFKNANVPSPAFIVARENSNLDLPFDFPVVVKPVDNMGGRGCKKANNQKELYAGISEALKFSRSGRAIVEEFMEGEEFSIDAIVCKKEITICGLAVRHIFYPPCFVEMGHTMPAAINEHEILVSTFIAGVRALGIDNGAAKGDIKLTPDGPMIGEIAARLSGGYMSGWTYPYSSGVNPVKAAILIATGKEPAELTPQHHNTAAERAFLSIPGTIHSIKGIDYAENRKWVKNIFLCVKAGDNVKFPENNVGKCGNVISAALQRDDAIESAESAVRTILIRLCPNNPETDSFLKSNNQFPPPAFAVDKAMLDALGEIPETVGQPPDSVSNFSQFLESAYKDYAGRSAKESLEAVRSLTGLPLPIVDGKAALGKNFWQAMIRGGYQGATYIVDSL
jgi:biotin carboxylase